MKNNSEIKETVGKYMARWIKDHPDSTPLERQREAVEFLVRREMEKKYAT